MSIGSKIFELRVSNNLSQGDLAEKLDVSRQSVSKWETDSSVPDLDKLIKMCDVFGVSLDDLTERSSNHNVEHTENINHNLWNQYVKPCTYSQISVVQRTGIRYNKIVSLKKGYGDI